MQPESKNPPVTWGYLLLGPGRPDRATQRRVMAHAGVDMGEYGTCWDDTMTPRTTRPQTQLESRNLLLRAVMPGDAVHFASLLCLGVSAVDVEWLLGELRDRGVSVVIHDGVDELSPGDEVIQIITDFDKRRAALMARRTRAKKKSR